MMSLSPYLCPIGDSLLLSARPAPFRVNFAAGTPVNVLLHTDALITLSLPSLCLATQVTPSSYPPGQLPRGSNSRQAPPSTASYRQTP